MKRLTEFVYSCEESSKKERRGWMIRLCLEKDDTTRNPSSIGPKMNGRHCIFLGDNRVRC